MTLVALLLAAGATTAVKVPDCYNEKEADVPGSFELTLDLTGRTAKDVFVFLSDVMDDPISPAEAPITNANHLNRKSDQITVIVRPNMHRFPKGTPLAKTKAKVEPKIKELMTLKGVTATCIVHGD